MENISEENNVKCNIQQIRVKYTYLFNQNRMLDITIKQLQRHLQQSEQVKNTLLLQQNSTDKLLHKNSHKSNLIKELTQQNIVLQESLTKLLKNNEDLSCELLMKTQVLYESEYEYNQTLKNYQEKILDLRHVQQNKQDIISALEEQIYERKINSDHTPTTTNITYINQVTQLKHIIHKITKQNQILRKENQAQKEQIIKIKQQTLQKSTNLIERNQRIDVKSPLKMVGSFFRSPPKQTINSSIKNNEETTNQHTLYKKSTNKSNCLEQKAQTLKIIIAKMYFEMEVLKDQRHQLVNYLQIQEQNRKRVAEKYFQCENQLKKVKEQLRVCQATLNKFINSHQRENQKSSDSEKEEQQRKNENCAIKEYWKLFIKSQRYKIIEKYLQKYHNFSSFFKSQKRPNSSKSKFHYKLKKHDKAAFLNTNESCTKFQSIFQMEQDNKADNKTQNILMQMLGEQWHENKEIPFLDQFSIVTKRKPNEKTNKNIQKIQQKYKGIEVVEKLAEDENYDNILKDLID